MANALSGTAGSVVYTSGGTALVGSIKEWSLALSHNPVETTAFNEDWQTYIPSIRGATGSFSGNYDASDTVQNNLRSAMFGGSAISLQMYVGSVSYFNAGTVYLTGNNPAVSDDGIVETAFDFTVSGPLTFISWLFADEFTTSVVAGSVNGTNAEPGTGTRLVSDSASVMSITGGALTVAAGTAPLYVSSLAIARVAGRVFLFSLNVGISRVIIGVVNSSGVTTGTVNAARRGTFEWNGTSLGVITSNSPTITVATVVLGTTYKFAILIRATGQMYFIKGGAFSAWTLLYIDTSNTDASLFPYSYQVGTTATYAIDYIHVPVTIWLPTPFVSDGFSTSFATPTDGDGHAEGVAGGIGSGGDGVTWTAQVGTWATAGGKLGATALSGGIAIATVPTGSADVLADIKVTRSAGQGGGLLRYTDANNYLYYNHDGTNAFLKQVLAGSTTTLITGAATYSANAVIRADVSGVNGRLYYNNALIGSTSSINAALTATTHGVYVTDVTANVTLDDLVIYAKGTNNEYAVLDMF